MKDPVLRVLDLVKNFPIRGSTDVVHAVNNVSLHVDTGETLGLVGESGSGKTTAGRCILGLIKLTSGAVYIKSQDITRMDQKELRLLRPRFQMVFQEPFDSLDPRMTVGKIIGENIYLEGRLSKQERIQFVYKLIEMMGLDSDYYNRYPHELTGGEQQRVGIARAMSTEPDLIVLDEVTSALDISVRGDIVKLLRKIQNESGVSYIFISHDLTAVREISDRVAIMYLGEIVEVGPNPEIFETQKHPYGQALLSSVFYPDPDAPFGEVKLKGEIPSPVNLPSGCFLHPRCPFVIDECKTGHPTLRVVDASVDSGDGTRMVACWRAEELLLNSGNK